MVDNADPMVMARIRVHVPDVAGYVPDSWAMPCVPVAGAQTGVIAVPPIGSDVWVEFEQGNRDRPIWVGGFWGSASDLPALASAAPPGTFGVTIQTPLQNGMVISDAPGPDGGGIVLKSASGASLIINDNGIHIDNGKGASIALVGPSVSINGDALVVT